MVIHLVFSVKGREPFLTDNGVRTNLYSYMAGILQESGCEPILINGTADHIHILCNLSKNFSVAKVVEELKKSSSKWIKTQGPRYRNFYWQGGYGVFSVSQSNVDAVMEYIASQEEHHRKASFQDEFRSLCRKHGIAMDERFAWE